MLEEKREHKMMNLLQMCSMITIESENIFFTNKMSFLWENCENKVKPHVNGYVIK